MAVHDSSKSIAEICFENDLLKKENHYLRVNLRDQFAQAAMSGILGNPENEEHYTGDHIKESLTYEQAIARGAYKIADAMMAAREAK